MERDWWHHRGQQGRLEDRGTQETRTGWGWRQPEGGAQEGSQGRAKPGVGSQAAAAISPM